MFCKKDTINLEKLLKYIVIHCFSDFTIAQIRSIKSLSILELLTSMSFTMLLVGFCTVGSYRSIGSDLFTWLNHQQTNSVRNMNNTLIGLQWKCLYITHKKRFPLFITMPNSFNIIGVDTLTHLRSRCFHLVNITTFQILLSSLKDLFQLPLSIFNAGWRILQSVSSSFPHIGTDTYFNDFMPMVFSKNSAYFNIYILRKKPIP